MCYVCSCFAWLIDFVQRIVTFVLACWISCAVTIGLLVAIVAGVAYGYNYSMAEFLTFTRVDTTVYMRRGQFYDSPDVRPQSFRRTGDEGDLFGEIAQPNESADYEARNVPRKQGASPLLDSWVKANDNRQYAEKVNKFRHPGPGIKSVLNKGNQADLASMGPIIEKLKQASPPGYYKMTSISFLSPRPISISPGRFISTAIFQRGKSTIIMRNFDVTTMKPPSMIENVLEDEQDYEGPKEKETNPMVTRNRVKQPPYRPKFLGGSRDVTRTFRPKVMRHWGQVSTPIFQDYSDDAEEDDAGYRPG